MPNNVRIGTQVTGVGKSSSDLDRLRDKFDKLQKQGGKGFAIGAGAAVTARALTAVGGAADIAVKGITDSINAASNLNESMSKSQAVFKGSSDEIEDWASTASDAFGQSKRQALEAAGTYGNLIQAFGIGADRAAEMSMAMTELASDLASFNNTSVDEAIEALRSGLSGETEPLKRYGVALNDVRLKEEAMRLGLIKTSKGVLPIAIKTQAAYSLILKDTALAQGDFARTSDGLANKQKILAARMEDLQAKVGGALLPKIIELGDAFLMVTDAADALTDVVGTKLPAAQGPLEDFIGVVTTGMRPDKVWEFVEALHEASENVVYDLTHMKTEAEQALEDQTTAWEDGRGGMQTAASGIGDAAGDMALAVDDAADDAGESFTDMVETATDALQGMIDGFFDPIETRADIYQAMMDQNAAEEALRDAETKREKREAADDIIESIDDQASALVDLGKQGDLTRADIDTFEANVKASYRALGRAVPKEINTIIEKLRALDRWDGHSVDVNVNTHYRDTYNGPKGGGKRILAAGGHVAANEPVSVGEVGQEMFVPDRPGTIVPNHKLGASGGGGGDNFYITFTGDIAASKTTILDQVERMRTLARYHEAA